MRERLRFMHSLRAFLEPLPPQIAQITQDYAMMEGKKESEAGMITSVKYAGRRRVPGVRPLRQQLISQINFKSHPFVR
jgi:hypothetical protein